MLIEVTSLDSLLTKAVLSNEMLVRKTTVKELIIGHPYGSQWQLQII